MTVLRVLHVDDEPDIREVVEMSLSLDPELETRSCGSGEEALAAASDWAPHIIVLDVMMPGMDGPATLVRLRENVRTAGIPVVFMTARAQSRELDLFRSLGVAGAIPKPFDPLTLASAVRRYIDPEIHQASALQTVFLQRMAGDALALAERGRQLDDAQECSEVLVEIRRLSHGLAGAGGIFGFNEVSDAAAAVENAIVSQQNGSGSKAEILACLERLLTCITATSSKWRGQAYAISRQSSAA